MLKTKGTFSLCISPFLFGVALAKEVVQVKKENMFGNVRLRWLRAILDKEVVK